MRFTLRDMLWLMLVLAIVLAKHVHEPPEMRCPCCWSIYPVDIVRSVSDY